MLHGRAQVALRLRAPCNLTTATRNPARMPRRLFSSTKDKPTKPVEDTPITWQSARSAISNNRWSKLIKLELSALVCFTSTGGYVLTGGSLFDVTILSSLLCGTMLSAASAATFNQLKERHLDATMARTRHRPLVSGALSPLQAQAFGWATGIGGVGLLCIGTTPATGALSLLTILTYTQVYTPLKRVSRFNTEVGALVGAIPPVMGWTAAMGSSGILTPEALFLATTLYMWQMHHFMAIAWCNRHDYTRANFVMQSVGDRTGERTVKKGIAWAVSMLTLPFASSGLGFTNPMFCVSGTAVNALFLNEYYKFYQHPTGRSARRAMIAGFPQLLAFFALMVFHLENRDEVKAFQQLGELREQGQHWCVYVIHKMQARAHWCLYFFSPKEKLEQASAPTSSQTDEATRHPLESACPVKVAASITDSVKSPNLEARSTISSS